MIGLKELKEKVWHILSVDEVIGILEADVKNGLSNQEAQKRLEVFGYNTIGVEKVVSALKIFLSQFSDFLVLVLIAALVVSMLLSEFIDAIAIFIIVILNSLLGFIQEYKAEKALVALKKLATPKAEVLRDGEHKLIDSLELVPGDIIFLEEGSSIPADGRIIWQSNFKTNEAALTGESISVEKTELTLDEREVPIGDRVNMVYQGTTVDFGHGRAIVTSTGLNTELGKIALLVEEADRETTPLQKRLDSLGKKIVFGILGLCALIFIVGILRGIEPVLIFLTAVSLAVAAIPEGLPAVVTIALSLGVQRMVKRNALVRKLPSVETLGSTTVICSDKTGTLTQNKMEVVAVATLGEIIYLDRPGIINETIKLTLRIGSVANNVYIRAHSSGRLIKDLEKDGIGSGDPMETAIIEAAIKTKSFEGHHGRVILIDERPFSSERKMMTTAFKVNRHIDVFSKGAPDIILPRCKNVLIGNVEVELKSEIKEKIYNINRELAGKAYRMIACAYKKIEEYSEDERELEEDLTFAGFIVFYDPPRPEVYNAVMKCEEAGIKPLIITGDHAITAEAIGREVGIVKEGDRCLTGVELDKMTDEELDNHLDNIKVFARVNPEHKLRIVRAFKKRGEIVAVTGDGVNDAPAITEADIGIAMGIKGTDVTKEASDLILLDDNFATIESAIEEGRRIYDNIAKFIHYLISCNIGEVFVMFFATMFGLPLPLLPIQILWVNLVTDGLPALALGIEPPEPDIITRKPIPPSKGFLSGTEPVNLIVEGFIMGVVPLLAFIIVWVRGDGLIYARTCCLSVLVLSQLFHSMNCRSLKLPLWKMNPLGNTYLVLAVIGSILLQLIIIYVKPIADIFGIAGLNSSEFDLVILLSLIPLVVIQLERTVKFLLKKRK
ncbi:MAG: calcium-translocating P-type ATPase, PMCA-type [bacterium]